MKILIDYNLFDIRKKYSRGIICSILTLSKSNHQIFIDDIDSIDRCILQMFKNENVKLLKNNKTEFELTFYLKGKQVLVDSHDGSQKFYSTISQAVQSVIYKNRVAVITRNTKETQIAVKINLDGKGKSKINTGIGFFDHMLEQISRHGNIDLNLKVKGDLHVDEHHTVEDTGIALGEAIKSALGNKIGIKRYGFMLPMDESFAKCAIDLGGRVYLNFKCKFDREKVGDFPTELCREFFKGISMGLNANILLEAKGENDHHKIEAMFKAFAKSLNEACRFDERAAGTLPTTKGII